MKVLFAVSNENISESIVKKYQKDYKEIITYKNVYYFNAILKELQRDKTYDRIVISEDLEPFSNNDYEAIDRFIFDKLDSISDEATDSEGGDTPIILICSDRRTKGEQLLIRLFGIGVYSALLGQDRSIPEVCKLIKKPRTKKEAKIYYKIESEDVNYQSENEDTVSEIEIQNIRAHYKKLGKNEDAYVDSFNNIASQYTDAQLKVIVKFLPLNVKAVLETNSPKYQSIMAFSTEGLNKGPKKQQAPKKEEALQIDFIENQLNKQKLTKPVIVPSGVDTQKVTKLSKLKENGENLETVENNAPIQDEPELEDINLEEIEQPEEENIKSVPTVEETRSQIDSLQNLLNEELKEESAPEPKRGRGRPRKIVSEEELNKPKRGRGRPRKVVAEAIPQEQETLNLFDLDDENKNDAAVLPGTDNEDSNTLPGFEDSINDEQTLPGFEDDDLAQAQENNFETNTLPGFDETNNTQSTNEFDNPFNSTPYNSSLEPTSTVLSSANVSQSINLESVLSKDKKIVAFVGTSKNGTSFLVNNLAQMFSEMGINTAILDMTTNKNAYYIYTKNEESLRKTAFDCMENLSKGIASGISVNKNLTVYTSLPTGEKYENGEILKTLVRNYSLVLIDCDFDTPFMYFENAQEIYLVQSMDILTIQPLTGFLRDLKAKNILVPEKIRIVINKQLRIRNLSSKVLIGGMSFYNDPAMSFMTELFNKDSVKYCEIPFDEQAYAKYLEGLVDCKVSLNGYSKSFIQNLKGLGNAVYPLLNNKYKPPEQPMEINEDTFSSRTNNTLEQMKKNY